MKEKRFCYQSWFPRKGLIRALLIVIGIFVCANLSGAIFSNDKQSDTIKSARIVKPDTDKKKNRKKPAGDVPQSTARYKFSFSEVSEMVQSTSCQFSASSDTIVKDGKKYTMHYSVDPELQKLGKSLMKMYHPKYGAIVAIEPSSGRILSLISYENDTVPKIGDHLYCKSTFPAASVFKTVTAAAAIEKANYSSGSIVRHVGKKSTLYKYQLSKELSSFTELPFEEAYAHSINPVFARIGMYVVGENSLTEYAGRLGFNTQVPFELPCEVSPVKAPDSLVTLAELASGFNEETRLTPLLGAMIASAICENGKMPVPSIVDSITNGETADLYRFEKNTWRTPLREGTARELRTMMKATARIGTARKTFRIIKQTSIFDSIDYGGKTGSVDKDSTGRVDWFIGFARNPYRQKERIAVGVVTVHGAYWTVHSSYIAAEYFRNYISALRKNEKVKSDSIKMIANNDKGDLQNSAQTADKKL